VQYGVYAVAVLGLYRCALRRTERTSRLLLCAAAGIVVSVPFVPPWDADRMRAYAATIPFIVVIPGLGLAALRDLRRTPTMSKAGLTASTDRGLLICGVGATVLLLLLPIVTRAIARPQRLPVVACGSGEVPRVIRLRSGSYLSLVSDTASEAPGVVRVSKFRSQIHLLREPYREVDSTFSAVEPPATLAVTSDLRTGEVLWLLAPADYPRRVQGVTAVCGSERPLQALRHVFRPSLSLPPS
jgi:hypothetical protein